jgi:hypothetical protein
MGGLRRHFARKRVAQQLLSALVRSTPLLRLFVLAGVFLVLLAPGCLGPSLKGDPGTQAGFAPGVAPFRTGVIDANRTGSEPSLALAPDGSVFVCSPRGEATGTDLWASRDGGTPFQYVGTPIYASTVRYAPVLRSGSGDVGGGDCDVSIDQGGRLYLSDLWGGGVSVSSSSDRGASWRGVPVSVAGAPFDRPWVLGGEKDEVFVTAAQPLLSLESRGLNSPPAGGIWVARSTDGGLTFPQSALAASNQDRLGLNGNLARDKDHVYLFYTKKTGEGRLAIIVTVSSDHGATWTPHVAAEQAFFPGQCFSPLNVFPVVAADGVGGVYLAWTLQNPQTQRIDLFMAASPDSGQTWNKPVLVTDRAGTRDLPWIATDGSGRVGLVWYETNATLLYKSQDLLVCDRNTPSDAPWRLHYAFSGDALNATPAFTEALVQPDPVHVGPLGQPYAEVVQVRFTPDGRAATAYVADVPEGKARPMFAIQTAPS